MDEGEDEEELRPYQDEERWVSDDTSTYPDNGIQWFIDDTAILSLMSRR